MTDLIAVNKWSEDYKKACELIHQAILISNPGFPKEVEVQGMLLENHGSAFTLQVNLRKATK